MGHRQFPTHMSTRSIVVVELSRAAEWCGYGVPVMKYDGERPQFQNGARGRSVQKG